MAEMILKSGVRVLIDDEDLPKISRWKWKQLRSGYVCRSTTVKGKWVCVLLHRLVMGEPEGMDVHHKFGIKTDNRKSQLEVIDPTAHLKLHAQRLVKFQKDRQIYPDKKNCVVCGSEFAVNPRKRKRHKCCSKNCAQSMRVAASLAKSYSRSQNPSTPTSPKPILI